MNLRIRQAAAAALTVVGLLSAAACGVEQNAIAAQSVASAHDLDTPAPQLVQFLRPFNPGPAHAVSLAEAPTSIDEAIEWSTVVLTARIHRVVDRGPFPKEKGSRDPDLRHGGFVLEPVEILRGRLQPTLDEVIVSFIAGDLDEWAEQAGPDGVGVFFLRWSAARPHPKGWGGERPAAYEREVYHWAHLTTVFVQGQDGVVAPMARRADLDERWPTVATEGVRFGQLSELAAAVSASKAQPQLAP